jgi:RHS repeat-associated protein
VLGGNREQHLTWDGLGRLVRLIEHLAVPDLDEPSYAYRWTARYDGLGRRVLARTEWGWWNETAQTFTPGLIGAGAGGPPASGLSTRATVVEESFHDPLVEFLEIAVETRVIDQGTTGNAGYVQASRTRAWKVHGPDDNGAYGGLQGIGGLEAVYEQRALGTVAQAPSWTGVIDDYYGHIIATVATVAGEVVSEAALKYHETKSIGYGPAPDSPVHYLSEGASLTQSTAWRGKRQDITGYYYLGARYYEPSSARFLSTDPMGHGASMSLYDYAGGDPINFVDPTGRSPSPYFSRQNSPNKLDSGFRFYEHTPGRLGRTFVNQTYGWMPHAYIMAPQYEPSGFNEKLIKRDIDSGILSPDIKLEDLPAKYLDYSVVTREGKPQWFAVEMSPINRDTDHPIAAAVQSLGNVWIFGRTWLKSAQVGGNLAQASGAGYLGFSGARLGVGAIGANSLAFVNITDLGDPYEIGNTAHIDPANISNAPRGTSTFFAPTQPHEDYVFMKNVQEQSQNTKGLNPPMWYNPALHNSNHWAQDNFTNGMDNPSAYSTPWTLGGLEFRFWDWTIFGRSRMPEAK